MVFLPAFEISVYQHQPIKTEIVVALDAGLHIRNGRNADGSVLMHDVHEYPALANFARADAFYRQGQLLLVIEVWEALVTVQGFFVVFCDFPDRNGNHAAGLLFHREVGTCLAALEKQLVVVQDRCSDDSCRGAAHPHLADIEVASVGDVVAFFHN